MINRPHYDLMKVIRSYCEHLNEGNFPLVDFFVESTYPDSKGEIRPCYLLTKKGCDMVANKLTGQKGVLFTAVYVTAFEQMREHIHNGTPLPESFKKQIAEAKVLNARARVSSQWLKISQQINNPEYKQICASYASGVLAGTQVIPLPEAGGKHYSAGEVGEMFGLSAQKIGRISNANGMKTDEYGKWFHDKSRSSAKEVDTFKYNTKAIAKFREIIQGREVS